MAGTGSKDLDQALAGTENEIFGEAFGADGLVDNSDDTDTSLEEMEDDTSDVAEDDGEGADGDDEAGDEDADGQDDADGGADGEAGAKKPGAEQDRDDDGKFAAKDGKSKDGERSDDASQRRGNPAIPLREERAKRQALESELEKERRDRATERETLQTRLANFEGRLDQIGRTQPATKTDTKDEAAEPDIFADPDGWKKWHSEQNERRVATVEHKLTERFVNASMARAHQSHKKTFEEAYDSLNKLDARDPARGAILQRIRDAADPGEELVTWHKKTVALREVGDDPTAYRQKLADELLKDPEFRKKLIAEMKGEAGGTEERGGKPRTIIRNPRSLNSEGGRAARIRDDVETDGSDKAIFDSAFA